MAKTRTIDNLGSDASVSYAVAQELERQNPLRIDPSPFQAAAEVTVTSPYVLSDFDELFNITGTKASWAEFPAPKNYEANRKKTLFSFQIIPNMGSIEHQEALKEKLQRIEIANRRKRHDEHKQDNKNKQRETVKILDLIEELVELDKILIYIAAKRGEFQRG